MTENKKNSLKSIYIWMILINALYILIFYFFMQYFS